MKEKHFAELIRRLGQNEIETGDIKNGMLTIKLDGYPACGVTATGDVYRRMGEKVNCPNGAREATLGCMVGPKADELYQQTAEIASVVHEYMTEMEQGTPMIVGGDEYRKLCEFNHSVLGGREMSDGSYQFATWLRENDGSLSGGNYCGENYAKAKANFAVRADLIPSDRLFTSEQLIELYRCAQDTLDSEYELSDAQIAFIEKTQEQIESTVPDLRERIAQDCSLKMSEGQTFGG